MNHIKNLRFVVGFFGFLSIGLYLVFAMFGQFAVSESVALSETSGVCAGAVYLGFLLLAFWNNNNLTSKKPTDEKEVAAWGVLFYLLFLAVEYLSYGSPMRGVLHAILPTLGLLIPSVVSQITKNS